MSWDDIFYDFVFNLAMGLLVVLAIDGKDKRLLNWVFSAPLLILVVLALELWPLLVLMEMRAIWKGRRR